MKNWQHGNGEGSSERTIAILSIIVIVPIVIWRVVIFVQARPELWDALKGLFNG